MSKAEARSREREAPADRTRRMVEEPDREASVQITYDSVNPEDGWDERSRTPNQGSSRSKPVEDLQAKDWLAKIQRLRVEREQHINHILQREALSSPADQEWQAVDREYVRALEAELRKYAGKDHK